MYALIMIAMHQITSLDSTSVDPHNISNMSNSSSFNLMPFFNEAKAEEEMDSSNHAFNTVVRTSKGEEKTVMKVLLEDVNNGDELVKRELDKLVERNEEQLIELKMGRGKLFEKDSLVEIQMVHDILEVRKKKIVDSFAYRALTDLIEHPVISAFIVAKWRHTKILFIIHTRTFMCFLGVFCFFVFNEVNTSVKEYEYDLMMKNVTSNESISNETNTDDLMMKNVTSNERFSNETNTDDLMMKNVTSNENISNDTNTDGCPIVEPKSYYKDKSSILYSTIFLIIFLFICGQIRKVIMKCKEREKDEIRVKCVNLWYLLLTAIICGLNIYVDRQPVSICSSPFLKYWNHGFFLIELLFLILTSVFTLRKMIFLVVFGDWIGAVKNYKEILEYLAFIGAFTIMLYKGQLKHEKVAAGLTALGVCTAWAVFVIKMGEPRFTMFGNFITMFHNILYRTSKYFLAILFLITGFAFAFWILQASMEKSKEDFYFNIWNVEMSSLVMSTGEFDFRDFFEAFGGKGENKIIVLFAMLLLFLMILFITITMLNLLQAVIIQDYERLMKDVYVQNLIFMANYIHNMETLVHNVKGFSHIFQNCCPWVKNCLKLHQTKIVYCPYRLCCNACPQATHIEPHFNQIIQGFNNILEQRIEQNYEAVFASMTEIYSKNEEDMQNIIGEVRDAKNDMTEMYSKNKKEMQNIFEEVADAKNELKSIIAILQSRNKPPVND